VELAAVFCTGCETKYNGPGPTVNDRMPISAVFQSETL
jgi:hypothetical protein